MPQSKIQFSFDSEKNLVLGYAEGMLEFDDFELHMQELSQNVDLSNGPDGLYDFTQVPNITGNLAGWEQTAHQICAIEPAREEVKIAIVVGENSNLVRLFDGWLVIMALSDFRYKLFSTTDEAKLWLATAEVD